LTRVARWGLDQGKKTTWGPWGEIDERGKRSGDFFSFLFFLVEERGVGDFGKGGEQLFWRDVADVGPEITVIGNDVWARMGGSEMAVAVVPVEIGG
jgi:hypothetical protein